MYFVEVSSQAPIVLNIFVSYIFHILLYAYVCVKCTKLFVHTYAEYVFFYFFINIYVYIALYVLFAVCVFCLKAVIIV